jgi:alpha-methylacyl-CoA racemase
MRPLAGVRILDLSRLLPGPYATSVLRALGADVLRVESPALVDYARGYPPFIDGVSAIFHVVNRGKRSIGLDLKNDAGRKVVLEPAPT